MPIREFGCPSCGGSLEEILAMNDESVLRCPSCGTPMERRLSVPARHRDGHGHAGAGTCCGRESRCDTPPCGDGGACCR